MAEIKFSKLCNFTSKQWDATETADTHRFTLFGGSRGPGKSYWLRWYSLMWLLKIAAKGLRNVRVMLACEDYPSLYERQISKIMTEFPGWLGSYHRGRNEFILNDSYGGGVIAFRNLDKPNKYQSAEFALIAVDEITKNPERTFHILRGSNRWPGVEDTKFVAASNPEANWVRDYWIEHRLPPEVEAIYPASEFAFVAGLPDDNPHLPLSYWRELESLPGPLKDAWRYGDWYAGVEGIVFETFGAENITQDEPDPEKPIELAFDDGYIDPRCVLFIQKTSKHILVFDEIWHIKRLEEETVQEVLDRCEANNWPLPQIAVGGSESNQLMKRFKHANIPARGGTHKIVQGITKIRPLFCDHNGVRVIKVNKRCKNWIDELSMGYRYPEGKRSLNEQPVDENNHGCDAFRTWAWLRVRA